MIRIPVLGAYWHVGSMLSDMLANGNVSVKKGSVQFHFSCFVLPRISSFGLIFFLVFFSNKRERALENEAWNVLELE